MSAFEFMKKITENSKKKANKVTFHALIDFVNYT